MYNRSQNYSNNRQRPQFRRFKPKEKSVDVALLVRKADDTFIPVVTETKHKFSDFLIGEQLKRNILDKGYTTPTPIQDEVIPVALQFKDVVGIANTGTGKTAAFLIPLINKMLFDRHQKVLIVAPTRELAVQIQEECDLFTKGLNLFSVLCIGGVSIHKQVHGLRRNPNIVIGTPGRLKDLKNQGKLSIALFNNIVLDEVDRMLDMGFVRDVQFIISHLPKQRQSLFFSATMTPAVRTIIQTVSNNPVNISVKTQETSNNIDQDIIRTQGRVKFDVLKELLREQALKKVIIFGRTKWGIEKLARQLTIDGVRVVALHGNKNQSQRQRALDQFRNSQVNILLATDIVARGIDIDDISHVINYDLPQTYDEYVHRIGRTGRNNKKGIALSFVD